MVVYPGDIGELIGEVAIWRVSRDFRCCGGENLVMGSFYIWMGFKEKLIKLSIIPRQR